MRICRGCVAVAIGLSLVATAAYAKKTKRSDRNVTIEISYGLVESVETVKLKSKAASGAAVGGFAGLVASHGDSTQRLETAAAGAAVGALIAQLATKHKAQQFVILRSDGSEIKVIIDHADAIAGDCVAVEEGPQTNLRRVSDVKCTAGPHHDDPDVQQAADTEASACDMAKVLLLDAQTAEEVEQAANKVKILCH